MRFTSAAYKFTSSRIHAITIHLSAVISVRQDWVTTLRDNNIVIGKKVATNLNLADIGTKILGPIIFEGLRNQILSTISDESINREFLLSTA